MQGLDQGDRGGRDRIRRQSQDGLLSKSLAALARMLEAERDRWILWVPVLFAAGIIFYFVLASEPQARLALVLLLGALGLVLTVRNARLGLCIGGAALAFASGLATAKLRTEMVRAPVLQQDLRYTEVSGFIEAHELRDKGRARITLRVLALGDLEPDKTPYRVRISMTRKYAADARVGEAVSLRATLQPPPEPIEPGGFDFARRAWFDRLGATGSAMSEIAPLDGAPAPPWSLAA
jgi:competence protein ComEC